jgi:hypothetical protein
VPKDLLSQAAVAPLAVGLIVRDLGLSTGTGGALRTPALVVDPDRGDDR